MAEIFISYVRYNKALGCAPLAPFQSPPLPRSLSPSRLRLGVGEVAARDLEQSGLACNRQQTSQVSQWLRRRGAHELPRTAAHGAVACASAVSCGDAYSNCPERL